MMVICLHGQLSYIEPTYDLSTSKPLARLLPLLIKYISKVASRGMMDP